jgi:hypothetical protein
MATATTVMMVLMVMVTTTVVVFTATVIMVTTASTTVAVTTTATCQVLHHVVYLFLRGIAVLQYGTLKIECLTCQRVVEVHLHLVLTDFHDATIETITLLVLQGNDGVLEDMLVVEMAVDAEHLTIEVQYQLVVVFAIAIFLAQRNLEVLAFLGGYHLLLKLVEGKAKAGNE